MNKYKAYFGDENYSEAEAIRLQAGPVSLLYQQGTLRSICLGEHEIVQRVYIALRDRFWNTIHPQITPFSIQSNSSSFHISFKALHKQNKINFLWRGEITGSTDGTIQYSMHGEALSTFQRNRIGFCVLHPLELCAGRACTIEQTDGNIIEDTFPVFISPFQPFKDIRQISYKVPSVGSVDIRFSGDTFEMEDQRNWTDASFKTYSTPLSLPIPAIVEQGDIIEQSVTIKVFIENHVVADVPKPIEVRIPEKQQSFQLPLLGSCHNHLEQLTPFSIELLQQLSLSHVRFEINCSSDTLISDIENAATLCTHLSTTAELALYFSANYGSEIQLLSRVLHTSQIPVSNFLIYSQDHPVTPAELISTAAPYLYSYAPTASTGAGTNSYFVELNRHHPTTDLLDLICYSANPQVHTFDNEAIITNLPGLGETLRTAALFQGKSRPAISPLTLRPRKLKPEKFGGADPRQTGLFGAAWTVGSLKQCIEGGAESVTLFETVGNGGLMPSQESSVYPVYHVVASIREMVGSQVKICSCTDQNKITSIALYRGSSMMLLLANHTDSVQQVTIFDLPQSVTFVSLDENSFEEATISPQQWRCKKGSLRTATGPFHIFDILPYAILRIEAPLI